MSCWNEIKTLIDLKLTYHIGLTDDTLSVSAFLQKNTAALIMFVSSALGVPGETSASFLYTLSKESSL